MGKYGENFIYFRKTDGFYCSKFLEIFTHSVNLCGHFCLEFNRIRLRKYKIWSTILCARFINIVTAERHHAEIFLARRNLNWQQILKLCAEIYLRPHVNYNCHCAGTHKTRAYSTT